MTLETATRFTQMLALAFVTACFATSATGEEIDADDCKEEDGCYIVYEKDKSKGGGGPVELGRWQLPQSKPESENIEVEFKPSASAAESGAGLSELKDCKEALELYSFDTFLHEQKKAGHGGECPPVSRCLKHANRRIDLLENVILGEKCKDILPDAKDMVDYLNSLIVPTPSPTP